MNFSILSQKNNTPAFLNFLFSVKTLIFFRIASSEITLLSFALFK